MNSSTEKMESKITTKTKRVVEETVKKYTEKDIKAIADSCYKLRSLNNKKNETRREFVNVFLKHHDTYRKVVNTYNDLCLNTANSGDTKKAILGYYVQLIRERQENAGLKDFLLNEVKFGFMKSIVKWVDTPGELDKSSSASSKGKDGSNKSKKKKEQISAKKIDLKVRKKSSTQSIWQLIISITNISKQPLQNIDLLFYDDHDDILSLSEVSGNHITLIDDGDTAHIDFILASMDENDPEQIDYTIKAPKNENFENLSKIEVKIENPSKGEIEKQEFNI